MPLIVVDPGHGGQDPGASANGLVEKNVTLALAQHTRDALVRSGFQVLLTREEDRLLVPGGTVEQDLHARAELANRHHADYFLSWHLDSSPDPSVRGTTGYIDPGTTGTQTEHAARIVLSQITAAAGSIHRGIRTADFAVLRETEMPAILVEAGFLTNPQEASLLACDVYLRLLAEGAAKGISELYGRVYVPPEPEPVSPVPVAPPSPEVSNRPSYDAWEAVPLVKHWGIMKGYPDGQFHPYDTVTREMLARTIVNLLTFLQAHGVPLNLQDNHPPGR